MCKVAAYIASVRGDIYSYLNHMGFIARHARLECYVDSTFVDYDRIVVNAVIKGEIATFVAGYSLAQALCFHSANHKSNNVKTKGARWFKKQKGAGSDGTSKSIEVC